MKSNDYNIIEVVRCSFSEQCTLGKLYLNDKFVCYTLEPPIPEFTKKKPYCIPYDWYDLTLDVISPKYRFRNPYNRFGGRVPRILNVTGFSGILIHIGNYPSDTKGCVLVGTKKGNNCVFHSTSAYLLLWNKLTKLKYPIKIVFSHV